MADKEPIVTHVYTADPSAHVFNGKLYIYPSHDRETDIKDNDNGDQYDMADYHVFSMEEVGGPVTDHGVVLKQEDVPWVSKQLWAPDAATKNGKYYLYFPARDKEGIFRVGVAVGDKPEGPFKPEPDYIKGSFSIDPATFVDDDGSAYLFFGGIWGGQLQNWATGKYDASGEEPTSGDALSAKVGKLTDDMTQFASDVTDVLILDPETQNFSYSTGDSHFLCYAIGDSPVGPFTYGGRILEPVVGWTTHHSIAEFKGKWYLFYHDSTLSGGRNHLRCVKIREIVYDEQGKIGLAQPQPKLSEADAPPAKLEG
jgi:hypothetical protein